MKRIRILQVNNLGIGPEGEDGPFSALPGLLATRGLMNKIDYLVVCGNFTQDRSHDSFQHAVAVMKDLALKVLPVSDLVANRVILVPGPSDVPDPNIERPDFTAFQEFFEGFFQEGFRETKKFDPQRAELRDLKDLTLIGLTYWKSAEPDVSRNRLRSFGDALGGAARSTSPAYVNSTPTLLVSAGTPLFPNGQGWPTVNPEIQKIFNTNLRISFHLFGAGPLENVGQVPFAYEHVSLGLGSGDLWPLRINLIELDGEPASDRPLGASWTALRQRASGEAWDERIYRTPFESRMVPSPEPQFEKLYREFLEQLADSMFKEDGQMIHVQGFPGSGISDVFNRLRREKLRQLGGRQVCIHDHHWKSEAEFNKFLEELARGGRIAGCAAHLIALYHPNFHQIPRESRKERIERILESCQTFFFQEKLFKLVYLTEFSEFTFFVEGRDELRCLALDETGEVPELLQHYTYRVPLHSSQVTDLTGGYAGLSQSLLRGCADTFSKWTGAQDIDHWTSAILLRDSFTHNAVRETCHRFLECVKNIGGGLEVFDYVRKKVLGHYEKAGIGDSAFFGRVEVDSDDLHLSSSSLAWSHMSSYQVLDRIGKSNRYRVRVVAPFLGQRSVRVFFSYFSRDKDYVQRIKSLLEALGNQEKTRVEVFDYMAEDRVFEKAPSIKADLVKHLERYRNLCIFQLDRGKSEMVDHEIEAWMKKWGWPAAVDDCRLMVLLHHFDSVLPGPLNGCRDNVIPIMGRTDEDMVAELFRRLVSEEMRWGFELKEPGAQAYSVERAGGR